VFLLVSVLVGDVASITSVAATLPTLSSNPVIRGVEREADTEAGLYLIEKGGNKPYEEMLAKLTKSHHNLRSLPPLHTSGNRKRGQGIAGT